jgi:hypothetical protein
LNPARRSLNVVGEALLHPLSLASLGVLVLNDHVLKAAWPGLLTGKLSDAAGLVVFPIFLHSLLEIALRIARLSLERVRRGAILACSAVTAAGFALVKSSGWANELFRAGLGALQCLPRAVSGGDPFACHARVVCDATDLWCLPFALVAVFLTRHSSIEGEPELHAE